MNENKAALADYARAIALNAEYTEAYLHRGVLLISIKEYNSAVSDFNKVIMINPKYAFAYYDRAKAKVELHDNSGACLDFNKANDLGLPEAQNYITKYCK